MVKRKGGGGRLLKPQNDPSTWVYYIPLLVFVVWGLSIAFILMLVPPPYNFYLAIGLTLGGVVGAWFLSSRTQKQRGGPPPVQ